MKFFITLFMFINLVSLTLLAGGFCPEKIQAVLLTKVVGFTKELGGAAKSEVRIGVLGGGGIVALLNSTALKSRDKISVRAVTLETLEGINILYVPRGVSPEMVQKAKNTAVNAKILTVAGDPMFVVDYGLTLAFHLVNKKPRILLNASASDEEGVKFAAQLLKIAQTQ